MPISYTIDHERRLVWAKGHGTFSHEDVFGYQREVWSDPQVAGYNELIDMTEVATIEVPSGGRVRELASLSSSMDSPAQASRFAIVAPADLAFGLGRMYETYRSLEAGTKQVGVFRKLDDALAFLGIEPKTAPKPRDERSESRG